MCDGMVCAPCAKASATCAVWSRELDWRCRTLEQVVSIDGTNVCGMTVDELKVLARGEMGTTVDLLVLRRQ